MSVETEDGTLLIRVNRAFRDRVALMIDRLWITGKRCHISDTGREVKPHQMALIEAVWEVAQRHPGEFMTAVMRRTEARETIGVRADHLATGHRPR